MSDKTEFTITTKRFRELIDNEKYKNVPRAEIAKATDCDTSTITKYYNGQRQLSVDSVIKFAKYFNVSSDYLLGLTDAQAELNTDNDKAMRICCDYIGLNENTINVLRLAVFPKGYSKNADQKNVNFICSVIDYLLTNSRKILERYELQDELNNSINTFDNSKNSENLIIYRKSLENKLLNLQALHYSLTTNFNALIESDNNINKCICSAESLINNLEKKLNQEIIEKYYEPIFKTPIGSKFILEVSKNKDFEDNILEE